MKQKCMVTPVLSNISVLMKNVPVSNIRGDVTVKQ